MTGLLCAAGAALCYGVASVLQALAAARTATGQGLDPRLLLRLAGQLPYVAGLALDGIGFVLNVAALRVLPLFLVQSVVAGSVGVTALAAAGFLHARLRRPELLALAALAVGLILLAAAAQPGEATPLTPTAARLLLFGATALAAVAWFAGRRGGGILLAALAGAGYAGVGIAARGLSTPRPLWRLVGEPAAWAIVVFGGLATLLFATALQRGRVTAVSAVMFAVETVVPAAVGLLVLGDATRRGFGPAVATAGFVTTLAASVTLAPYAEPPGAPGAAAARAPG